MPILKNTAAIGLVMGCGLLAGFLAYRGIPHPATTSVILTPAWISTTQSAQNAADAADSDTSSAQNAANRPVPETVPDLRLPDLAGKQRSLRDFLGQPLIINFWATWCAPCRREIPLLQRLHQVYGHGDGSRGSGLQIVGIAVDFRTAVVSYLRHNTVGYPLLIGETDGLDAAEQFGMEPVLPFSVFADAQGRIIAVKIGELHRQEADYILDAMRSVAAGRFTLADARTGIAQRLKQLSIERASATVTPP